MNPEKARSQSRAAVILLALLACALCVSTYFVFGHTWDEPGHIAAGMDLLERGDYIFDEQHPPLGRLAAALGPYLAGARLPADAARPDGPWGQDLSGEREGRDILYTSPAGYEKTLTLARLAMLPFLVILILAAWAWAQRTYGPAVAVLAVAFLVSTPAILGHAGIAALDVPMTGLAILSIYLLLRWFEQPSLGRAAVLGIAAGLAVSTKLSAIPFIGMAGISLIAVRLLFLPWAPIEPRWRARFATATAAALIVVVIWLGTYGDHLTFMTSPDLRPSKALDFLAGKQGWFHDLAYRVAAQVAVPIGVEKTLLGLLAVTWHNSHGHASFLLGETSLFGWWYFYPLALAVKTPLPLLLLGLPGLVLLGWRGLQERNVYVLAPALCFAAILSFCCLYSHINIGVRHVLVLYPLLAMGAAYLVVTAWQGARQLLVRGLLTGLVLWQVSTVAIAYPDYLAYFNFTVGGHPERVLVDSDLDWGQDLRRLVAELKRRQVPEVQLAYRGSADLGREDLPPYRNLGPNQRVAGWVAIDMLTKMEARPGFDWLDEYVPVQHIGKSIDLYYIPPE